MAEFLPVDPFDLIIVGATGSLSQTKLLPALYHRFCDGQINSISRIVGVAQTEFAEGEFQNFVKAACIDDCDSRFNEKKWQGFQRLLHYRCLDASADLAEWADVKSILANDTRPRIFYLALAPDIYVPVCNSIKRAELNNAFSRLVLEKPIGSDLKSAEIINDGVQLVFQDNSIFRMDHYLGKETVQNLLVLRFANSLYEPLWNKNCIDHIQITVAETLGVADRASYYDRAGAVRDIVQNHILQILCLLTMEPPSSLSPANIRQEKIKVLQSLHGFTPETVSSQTVKAQYESGKVKGETVCGYRTDVASIDKNSNTETYVAVKTSIENWRWSGMPIYLRTGKRMASKRSEVMVQFKEPPHDLFSGVEKAPNKLVLSLQPNEGVKLFMQIKEPGPGGLKLRSLPLDLSFDRSFEAKTYPDAYERLLMDVVRGNLGLFMGHDEVAAAWNWTDNLLSVWDDVDQPLSYYSAGTDGPIVAQQLIERDGRSWWNAGVNVSA